MSSKIPIKNVFKLKNIFASQEQKIIPVKLAYNLFKPSTGIDKNLSPIIFLHMGNSSKENWNNIPQKVANETKRVAYTLDNRNHGDSVWTDDYNFYHFVEDVFYFMDTINAPKAVLIGHSMGATIASRMALKKPERVEMFISEDMSIRKYDAELAKQHTAELYLWRDCVRKVPKGMEEKEALKFVVDSVYSKRYKNVQNTGNCEVKEYLYNINFPMKRMPDGGYDVKHNIEVMIRTLKNPDALASDPQSIYFGSTYFLYGAKSPMEVYKDEELIRRHFPKVKFIRFDDGGHYLHLKFPEKFAATVAEYILLHNKSHL